MAEGVPTESCYLGPMVLQHMSRSQLRTVMARFPALKPGRGDGYGRLARPVLKVREARRLLATGQLGFACARGMLPV